MTGGKIQWTLICSFLSFLILRGFANSWKEPLRADSTDAIDLTLNGGDTFNHAPTRRRLLSSEDRAKSQKEKNVTIGAKKWQTSQSLLDKEDAKFVASVERKEGEPYTLGPKIFDWDDQRETYIEKHPGCNKGRNGEEKILLVTGSQPKMCPNEFGDHFLLKSLKNKLDYCNLQGIDIFYNLAVFDAEMSGFWAKLPLMRRLMLSHPEVEWFWWMDSDAMFTDMTFKLPMDRYKQFNLVLHGWDEAVYYQKDWVGLNTGSFLMRNNQWMLDLLDEWAKSGPKGKIREEAGALLTAKLKGRPVFEADDQSALVWLLYTQKRQWREHTYLESAFYLHGYWDILVHRYEEMMEKHHPGLGDDRWPFVTHFVGCKPCGKMEELDQVAFRKCSLHMERAFNFADNQLLQQLGFQHIELGTSLLRPINETTRITEAALKSAQRLAQNPKKMKTVVVREGKSRLGKIKRTKGKKTGRGIKKPKKLQGVV